MPKHIYMVGIGGIGMSALAQYLAHEGHSVCGSDRDDSPTVAMLREKGIQVCTGHDECAVPGQTGLLIYSDAVPSTNFQREEAKKRRISELSYFEALGEVTKGKRTIAVAGTHGKTTTTGMLAKILQEADVRPTAIVGSIVRDFGSNFLAGKSDVFVVEACEYRDHVLKLSPDILVITNIELDHTDYFPDLSALEETFAKAAAKVPASGFIITNPSDPSVSRVIRGVSATIIDYTKEEVPELGLIGEFNRMNARAAAAAARAAFPDLKQGTIDRALADFKGSWRRFEYKGETPQGAMVFDDYAHHPTAIEKTIEAARQKYPDKKIVLAFHPHLYSRTKSLLEEFAAALSLADRCCIAPIYAAREVDDGSISSAILAERARLAGGAVDALDSFDAIRERLLTFGPDHILITMGAGDIYKVADQIAD